MVNYNMSYKDFEKMLIKQTGLLVDLCNQFDKGNYDYADVIATKIGALINFNNVDSILPNMGKQMTMRFCSTSKILNSTDDVLLYRTLVASTFNKDYSYFPKFDYGSYPKTWVDFETWAKTPVFIYNSSPGDKLDGLIYIAEVNKDTQLIVSREKIIRFYRNKYGGAHSDVKLNDTMFAFAEGISSIEFSDHQSTKYLPGEKYKAGKPYEFILQMAIRQIAHELILSIKKEFNFNPMYRPKYTDFVDKHPRDLKDPLFKITKRLDNDEKQINIIYI